MHNNGGASAVIRIEDAYKNNEDVVQVVLPWSQRTQTWRLQGTGAWYDLTFTAGGGFERCLAGCLETGGHGISDPLMEAKRGWHS